MSSVTLAKVYHYLVSKPVIAVEEADMWLFYVYVCAHVVGGGDSESSNGFIPTSGVLTQGN